MAIHEIIKKESKNYDSFYIYDESIILEQIKNLKENFKGIDFLYSVKCNPNSYVIKSIFSQGFGADAASLEEVIKAHNAGLTKDKIYFSAPGKTAKDIENSLSKAILIADSLNEIELINQIAKNQTAQIVDIGIRINPNFSFYGNHGIPSKFGIDEQDAIDFIKNNNCTNIRINGIHVHLKSQELDINVLKNYYKNMFTLAEKIQSITGINLDYINLGSGIGIQYSPNETPLNVKELGAAALDMLYKFKNKYPNTKVIIETGRYAVGKSGLYVTKVLDRKQSYGKTYIILKNTLNGFVRPSIIKLVENYSQQSEPSSYEPFFTNKNAFEFETLKPKNNLEKVSLVGNLCTAIDVIATDIDIPRLDIGDIIIINNAGAYARSVTPMQFASLEKPKELFVDKNGTVNIEE